MSEWNIYILLLHYIAFFLFYRRCGSVTVSEHTINTSKSHKIFIIFFLTTHHTNIRGSRKMYIYRKICSFYQWTKKKEHVKTVFISYINAALKYYKLNTLHQTQLTFVYRKIILKKILKQRLLLLFCAFHTFFYSCYKKKNSCNSYSRHFLTKNALILY